MHTSIVHSDNPKPLTLNFLGSPKVRFVGKPVFGIHALVPSETVAERGRVSAGRWSKTAWGLGFRALGHVVYRCIVY